MRRQDGSDTSARRPAVSVDRLSTASTPTHVRDPVAVGRPRHSLVPMPQHLLQHEPLRPGDEALAKGGADSVPGVEDGR